MDSHPCSQAADLLDVFLTFGLPFLEVRRTEGFVCGAWENEVGDTKITLRSAVGSGLVTDRFGNKEGCLTHLHARAVVPADCRVDLFASEPEIGKPIALAWDERGRCWIAETSDYPHGVKPDGVGTDRIRICEEFSLVKTNLQKLDMQLCFTTSEKLESEKALC